MEAERERERAEEAARRKGFEKVMEVQIPQQPRMTRTAALKVMFGVWRVRVQTVVVMKGLHELERK